MFVNLLAGAIVISQGILYFPSPIPEISEQPPKTETFTVTAYTAFCDSGCTGVTATGVDVRDSIYYKGKRIVAVDPDVVPLGTTVKIHMNDGRTITAIAKDTGGAINGHDLDLLVKSKAQAMKFGRQQLQVQVIEHD